VPEYELRLEFCSALIKLFVVYVNEIYWNFSQLGRKLFSHVIWSGATWCRPSAATVKQPVRHVKTAIWWGLLSFSKGCSLFRTCYGHGSNLSLAKIEGEKPEIRILVHITFCTVKIRDISLSRIEPFGTRDTPSDFGTVPKNSGRLATLGLLDYLWCCYHT